MVDREKCTGCAACMNACPTKCITMLEDELGFLYPYINKEKCIHCNKCESVCSALHPTKSICEQTYAWGGFAADETIRSASSSGGVFSVLATEIISNGGVVYGCALTDSAKQAGHIRVDSTKDLYKLRGSKYVQSSMDYSFQSVKEDLLNGIQVLFSGTPCQIDALNMFLNKEYRNLITVEIICHGVPSPLIFKNYIIEKEDELGDTVTRVYFRDETGGGILIMRIETEKGYRYKGDSNNDPYYRLFLSNVCLRDSCYLCQSKGDKKRADLTLGDFWGVEDAAPELVDGKGMSLVLIHSEKGSELFKKVNDKLIGKEVDFKKAIKGNPAYFTSYPRVKKRNYIQKDAGSISTEKLAYKYAFSRKEKLKQILIKLHVYELIRRVVKRS